jgi:hypothetical protein
MTLRFSPATGRLWATDDTLAGAPVVFDTDDGLLFVDPADVFVGSVAIPARTASSTGVDGVQTVVDTEADYFIGVCSSPGSRYVRGMIRTTASASGEMMDAVWRQASGTHLDIMDGVSQTMVPQTDLAGFNRLASLRGFTFFVNELGHLVLRERSVARARDSGSPPASVNRSLAASTVAYRLLVGSFFGADFGVRPGVHFRGASGSFLLPGVSRTFAGVPFSYAYPGRRLVVVVNAWTTGGTGPVVTGVTIGGVPAEIHGGVGGVAGNDTSAYIASAVVPTGTSGDVVVTFSAGPSGAGVHMYAVANEAGVPTVTTAQVIAASEISQEVTVGANQIGIAAVAQTADGTAGTDGTSLWANADVRLQLQGTSRVTSAVIPAGSESVNVSQTWSFAQDQSMLVAVWS